MCLPFSPNHVKLIEACYPPTSTLLAADSAHRPNAQELSRLTYYASNRTTKIPKVGIELDRLLKLEARKAQAGYARARAKLLVTLAIYQALITECKRDVSLILRYAISSVDTSLSQLPTDLEVAARAASVFTALTTYTDGHLIGVDAGLTKDYISVLSHFSKLCCKELDDTELQNRTRLVGFAALSALVDSEALYGSVHEFKKQASIIVPAIFFSLRQASLSTLEDEAAALKSDPGLLSAPPYMTEFSSRPMVERRAPSIHTHIDGEKGPEYSDVINACLRVMMTLMERCIAPQISQVLEAAIDWMESNQTWDDTEFCRWLAEQATEWAQYQYRYAVPTKLTDRLLEVQDTPAPTPLHFAITSMLTTVFTSPHPLANLSTSDMLGHLISVLLRRVSIDPDDPLIPALIECTASLGTHVYYADQIQDMAEELVSRLVGVQVNGLLGRGRPGSDRPREQAIRCLLACLIGLINTADSSQNVGIVAQGGEHAVIAEVKPKATLTTDKVVPAEEEPANPATVLGRTLRRNQVSPELWQETLVLLCEAEYGVRATYARALHRYVRSEIQPEPFVSNDRGTSKVVIETEYISSKRPSLLNSDTKSRFLNALHASAYMLATASSLGISSSPVPSSLHSSTHKLEVNIIAATPKNSPSAEVAEPSMKGPPEVQPNTLDVQVERGTPSPSELQPSSPQRTPSASRSRKTSLALKLLDPGPNLLSSSGASPARASDYAHILEILIAVHEKLPCRAVLTGVPMLLALDSMSKLKAASEKDTACKQRVIAVREVIARVWLTIGTVWDVPEVVSTAKRALLPYSNTSSMLPPVPVSPILSHREPEQPVDWLSMPNIADSDLERTCIDPEAVLTALASSNKLQTATGLDRASILRKLSVQWSMEVALTDSVERVSNEIARGEAPLLRLSPALMHIDNLSLASIARSSRGVGVGDLREALGGRGSMSNPALATPARSISTYEQLAASHHGALHPFVRAGTPKRTPKGAGEVRDVLNKLGIGKQNGGSRLQTPFPAIKSSTSIKITGENP